MCVCNHVDQLEGSSQLIRRERDSVTTDFQPAALERAVNYEPGHDQMSANWHSSGCEVYLVLSSCLRSAGYHSQYSFRYKRKHKSHKPTYPVGINSTKWRTFPEAGCFL